MAAEQGSTSQCCHLAIAAEKVALRSSTGSLHSVSRECIAHSQLLQDLVSTGGGAHDTPVPLSEEAFRLWMHSVNNVVARATAGSHTHPLALGAVVPTQPSRLHVPSGASSAAPQLDPLLALAAAPGLAQILTAADVLIDGATKRSAAAQLAVLLLQPAAEALLSGDGQVMSLLPQHLLLAVLSHLPTTTLAATRCTDHPSSVNTHHFLHLHSIPPDRLHAALSATTALTSLQELSLDGATFPHECESCIGILQRLPSVTALSMRDAGIKEPLARALAAALPAMPRLASLDLSSNRITRQVAQALRRGLSQCTALLDLRMSHWAIVDGHDPDSIIEDVVGAVMPLHQLTALSFGLDWLIEGWRYRIHFLNTWREQLAGFQRAVSGMPKMKVLKLHCPHFPISSGRGMAEVLVHAPGLHHLCLYIPDMSDSFGGGSCLLAELGRAVGSLALLTSLEMHVGSTLGNDAAHYMQSIASFFLLRELRLVTSVEEVEWDSRVAPAVAEVLPRMTQLTQLHFFTSASEYLPLLIHKQAQAKQLVAAAAAAPQLRELVLSLRLCACDEALVAQLLGATQLQRLQLELWLQPPCSQADCEMVVPLLPYTTKLIVRGGRQGPPSALCLQPLLDGASSLCSLRVLDIECARNTHGPTDFHPLLNSVACMTALQRLKFKAEFLSRLNDDGSAKGVDLQPFYQGLHTLRGLSGLHWHVTDGRNRCVGQGELLRACRLLPCLQVLRLGFLDDAAAFMSAVPHLPLRRLHMPMRKGMQSAKVVADVLERMEHLREACFAPSSEFSELDSDVENLLSATAAKLSACYFCNVGWPEV